MDVLNSQDTKVITGSLWCSWLAARAFLKGRIDEAVVVPEFRVADTKQVVPFLKWPGGKRWAASHVVPLIQKNLTRRYFEPFLGGGAIFFSLLPEKAELSDINEDLINTYNAVRDHHVAVIHALRQLRVTKRNYYEIRSAAPHAPIERAARFLYLNRTAFGGMYRLNLAGEFNVPYGGGERTPDVLLESDMLIAASKALKRATTKQSDFESQVDSAGKGDVVYCDPTYTVAHDRNCFVRYNERNFSWADQERLACCARRARSRGAMVIVTNAHHRSIRALYPQSHFNSLGRLSLVSTDPLKRRAVQEYLIIV